MSECSHSYEEFVSTLVFFRTGSSIVGWSVHTCIIVWHEDVRTCTYGIRIEVVFFALPWRSSMDLRVRITGVSVEGQLLVY